MSDFSRNQIIIFHHLHSPTDRFNGMKAVIVEAASGPYMRVLFENGVEGLCLREEMTPAQSETPIYDRLMIQYRSPQFQDMLSALKA